MFLMSVVDGIDLADRWADSRSSAIGGGVGFCHRNFWAIAGSAHAGSFCKASDHFRHPDLRQFRAPHPESAIGVTLPCKVPFSGKCVHYRLLGLLARPRSTITIQEMPPRIRIAHRRKSDFATHPCARHACDSSRNLPNSCRNLKLDPSACVGCRCAWRSPTMRSSSTSCRFWRLFASSATTPNGRRRS